MAGAYAFAVEGLSALSALEEIPGRIALAAQRAINATADRGRAAAAREIRKQVNFPASYLTGDGNRLIVTQRASADSLQAKITGRQRATSLARFSTGGSPGAKQAGVTVEVKTGSSRFMKRGFLIKLRSGTANIDTKSNLGLAIRLKPGESIQNKRNMIKMSNGLYLLYGPSVDQVFRTVAGDISEDLADYLESEFNRLLDLNL